MQYTYVSTKERRQIKLRADMKNNQSFTLKTIIMKNFSIVLTFALAIFFSVSANAQARFASNTNSGMSEAFETKLALTLLALEASGYEVEAHKVLELREGQTYTGFYSADAYDDHTIIAVSEEGVMDLDIEILRNGRQMAKDTEADEGGAAIVNYTAFSNQRLEIKVKNYDSVSSYRNYPVVLLIGTK